MNWFIPSITKNIPINLKISFIESNGLKNKNNPNKSIIIDVIKILFHLAYPLFLSENASTILVTASTIIITPTTIGINDINASGLITTYDPNNKARIPSTKLNLDICVPLEFIKINIWLTPNAKIKIRGDK